MAYMEDLTDIDHAKSRTIEACISSNVLPFVSSTNFKPKITIEPQILAKMKNNPEIQE